MSNLTVFSSKLVAETVDVQFDFSSMLAIGETISSAEVTAEVFQGLDNSPSSIISGAASPDGNIVNQAITAGTAGVVYTLSCAITTSLSQSLILQGRLAILSNNPFQ